jgi:hypothetical protein
MAGVDQVWSGSGATCAPTTSTSTRGTTEARLSELSRLVCPALPAASPYYMRTPSQGAPGPIYAVTRSLRRRYRSFIHRLPVGNSISLGAHLGSVCTAHGGNWSHVQSMNVPLVVLKA